MLRRRHKRIARYLFTPMNPFDTEYIFHAPHLGRAFAAALEKNVRLDDEEVTESWAKALIKDAGQARASDIHLDPQISAGAQNRSNSAEDGRWRMCGALFERSGANFSLTYSWWAWQEEWIEFSVFRKQVSRGHMATV
jgi:hypothetical protein